MLNIPEKEGAQATSHPMSPVSWHVAVAPRMELEQVFIEALEVTAPIAIISLVTQ